ncbi:7897_t:CDS:2, partial [Scutellospora calospora]
KGDPKRVRYQLGSICKLELENILHSSIKSASNLVNEYKDLQGIYLKQEKELELKALSLDKDKILCLKDEIDKLKAEVEELESKMELEHISYDSDTTLFRDKISKLNFLNRILEQKRDDLNSKKHELEAEVKHKDFEITSLGAKSERIGRSVKTTNILVIPQTEHNRWS